MKRLSLLINVYMIVLLVNVTVISQSFNGINQNIKSGKNTNFLNRIDTKPINKSLSVKFYPVRDGDFWEYIVGIQPLF